MERQHPHKMKVSESFPFLLGLYHLWVIKDIEGTLRDTAKWHQASYNQEDRDDGKSRTDTENLYSIDE
jgi:hypothetical protein